MNERRRQLWIAMANLWLDTELTQDELSHIARAVRDSGLDRDELETVFRDELAPILGWNLLSVAGEWGQFDPDWVCERAQRLQGKRRLMNRLMSAIGLTTYAARPAWNRVLEIAFDDAVS